MLPDLDDVTASYHRCRASDRFIDTFYEHFLAKSREVAADFGIGKGRMVRSLCLPVRTKKDDCLLLPPVICYWAARCANTHELELRAHISFRDCFASRPDNRMRRLLTRFIGSQLSLAQSLHSERVACLKVTRIWRTSDVYDHSNSKCEANKIRI